MSQTVLLLADFPWNGKWYAFQKQIKMVVSYSDEDSDEDAEYRVNDDELKITASAENMEDLLDRIHEQLVEKQPQLFGGTQDV